MRKLSAALAAFALLACQKQTPEQELLEQAGTPTASWISTLQMTGEKWAANSVPTSFVRTTSKAAGDAFDQAAEAVEKSKARPDLREPLRAIVAEARDAGVRLRKAIDKTDRPEAARQVSRLATLRGRCEALQRAPGGGS